MCKVLFINSEARTIVEYTSLGLEDLQALVGGYIERACILENGDEVYCNEEGLLGSPENFFFPIGAHQPFAGNGYIIGPVNEEGDNLDVQLSVIDAVPLIKFLTLLEVQVMYA